MLKQLLQIEDKKGLSLLFPKALSSLNKKFFRSQVLLDTTIAVNFTLQPFERFELMLQTPVERL